MGRGTEADAIRGGEVMENRHDEAALALLNALLRALEMLTFVARHLHPPDFEDLMGSIGAPDVDL
jgi:hypothetical protein